MSGIQVTLPLHLICRLLVAGHIVENVTLPLLCNSSVVCDTIDSRILPAGYVSLPELGAAYKFFDTKLTYDQAETMCSKDNGKLALIDSIEKANKIADHFSFHNNAWVGLRMSNVPGTSRWITIDGKSTSHLPWTRGQPSGDYRCVLFSRDWRGLINQNCLDERNYMCEIALPRN